MSIFNQIINGKGHPDVEWLVVLFEGNESTTVQTTVKTYAEALAAKVNHLKSNDILIELWSANSDVPFGYIGDERDFIHIQNFIKDNSKYIC